MIRQLLFLASSGCATLVGIDDHQPLTCQSLAVVTDGGATVAVTPAFASDQPSYHAAVAAGVASVQVAIACDDVGAAITANGMAVTGGKSPSLPATGGAVIDVAVAAGNVDHEPMLSYQITIDEPTARSAP